MNAGSVPQAGERPIDHWFAHYSGDHVNPVNQRIHVVAVPLILWSVVGLLWCIPVPGTTFRPGLLQLAAGVFVVAWIAQFIGHSKLFEGKKPSFLTDLKYLLIGPAWVLAKGYRRLGWGW